MGFLDLIYLVFVLNFQIAWLIYGNTFHYSVQGQACRNISSNTNSLWILMMFILAIGYLYLIAFAVVCCCVPCMLCIFCCMGGGEQQGWGLQHQ